MTYNLQSANPFISGGEFQEWSSNSLILKDPGLRKKAGVHVLDEEVTDVYRVTPTSDKHASNKHGGNATGAPFGIQYYGSPQARPYADYPGVQGLSSSLVSSSGQFGGASYPQGYFQQGKLW